MSIPGLAMPRSYRRSSDLSWTVEVRGLSMFTPERGMFCCLPYPAAAVWDLLDRGYNLSRIANLMQQIAGVDEAEASDLVVRLLHQWTELGLLEEVDCDG